MPVVKVTGVHGRGLWIYFRSTNCGATWTNVYGTNGDVSMITANGNNIYASLYYGVVHQQIMVCHGIM